MLPLLPMLTSHKGRSSRPIVATIVIATVAMGLTFGAMTLRAEHRVNRTALAGTPRPVSFVSAEASAFRDSRTYVGSIEPWVEANVGPQYVSAYVERVLVRPGDAVAHGAVVATLDCSNPSASSRAAEMQARAVDARQRALTDEAARVHSLLDGGFVAVNEAELKRAQSDAERAQLLQAQAKLAAAALDVRDCVLRAPFDGEIATRPIDPGAFVHPGATIVSVVDRNTVRVTADAPEKDFEVVGKGAPVTIEVLSTGARVDARVSRRAPKADSATRTIHFEIDVPDPTRAIPVATTGLVHADVGEPRASTRIPVRAAMVTEHKAKLFVLDGDVAHEKDVAVVGESMGSLFVDPTQLPVGTHVVVEGRALLHDGDRVTARPEVPPPAGDDEEDGGRGGGSGRPM